MLILVFALAKKKKKKNVSNSGCNGVFEMFCLTQTRKMQGRELRLEFRITGITRRNQEGSS